MVAVITSANYRMTMALMRDLADNGITIIACYYGNSEPFTVKSKSVSKAVQVPDSKQNEQGFIEAVYGVCKSAYEVSKDKPVLLPISTKDLEILSLPEVHDRFSRVCHMGISSQEKLDFANNKLKVAELCETIGMSVPKTEHPTSRDDFEGYKYPLIIRPVCGEKQGLRAGERFIVAENSEDAIKAWEYYSHLCGETVIQSYLRGDIVQHTVILKDGVVTTVVTEGSVRTRFRDGGHPTITFTMLQNDGLDLTRKLAKQLGLTGLFMFQYMRTSSGEMYIMEINCRMCGSYPVCRKSHSSMSYDWFAVSCGREPKRIGARKEIWHYFLPSEVFYALEKVQEGHVLEAFSNLCEVLGLRHREGLFEWSDFSASCRYLASYVREYRRGNRGSSRRAQYK